MSLFPAVRIEGGLFAADLLEQVLAGDLRGQKPQDFGLKHPNLANEVATIFSDAQTFWETFKRRLERLPDDDPATTQTRNQWMLPFLSLLGYELFLNRRAYKLGAMTFAISHRAGEPDDAPPVHIVGARQPLDRVHAGGRPRLSPHSLLQEFLNRSDALWGIVTNGRILRLLRRTSYIRRQCYLEFNLETIFEQRLYQDFALLFRLLHRSRLPRTSADAHECFLERYYQESLEQGSRVRDRLRDGVHLFLISFANGFLAHPKNELLRKRISLPPSDPNAITPDDFYHHLLRIVYRILFLFVAEDRGLLGSETLYREHYGITRFRRLVDRRSAYTEHDDLCLSLRLLWKLLNDDTPFPQLGGKPLASVLSLPVLNGQLFGRTYFDECLISNRDLLEAMWHIVYYTDESGTLRRVNYAALDVEELGSVYESLLDYQPRFDTTQTPPLFRLEPAAGTARKSTGSYYTPHELVSELVTSALDPVICERLKNAKNREEKEKALLSIKVCDPACGSGHFLLAAARRLGRQLARIRTAHDEPTPQHTRRAVRDVISHCIYGVDKNPLAVELCKVALWIESHDPEKPLTFLDHRIRCGDSLLGVINLSALKDGIPDNAFNPVSDDDKSVARFFKKKNREERLSRQRFLQFDPRQSLASLAAHTARFDHLPDDSPEIIRKKKEMLKELERESARDRTACDIWTAAFFAQLTQHNAHRIPTTQTLRDYLERSTSIPGDLLGYIRSLARKHRFFHWSLEFPDVFARGGFDVVLCNPPWDVMQPEEGKFFRSRAPEIAALQGSARKRAIQNLRYENPALFAEWSEHKKSIHQSAKFIKQSTQFRLIGKGKINTYAVFAELFLNILNPSGIAAVIVPTGIATDHTTSHFFSHLTPRLLFLYDFENRMPIFPDIHRSYKFCLIGFRKTAPAQPQPARFLSFAHDLSALNDRRRFFSLSHHDFALLNPNTRTLPVFRTYYDAELTKKLYRRMPILINETTGENPWKVKFRQGLFNMTSDSHLFRTREQLERDGFRLVGNRFVKGSEIWLPLYEAKMIWHYDHRFGTFEGVSSRSSTHLPTPTDAQHADPNFLVLPWYWVPKEEVDARLKTANWSHKFLLGFRDITNATNERTAVFALIPPTAAGHTMPLMFASAGYVRESFLAAYLSSCLFDYVVRQKVAGTHLTYNYLKQLPILPPDAYGTKDRLFIVPRVMELVYTAWDIKPFADGVWREADEELRSAIKQQWEKNAEVTGGHKWEPPSWLDEMVYPEIVMDKDRGIPFPPFKWDGERRAKIRAELDAYFGLLYGLTEEELRYILDPQDVMGEDWCGETFRVLKEKEVRVYGTYRTRDLVLSAWRKLKSEGTT